MKSRGSSLILMLVFTGMAALLLAGFVQWSISTLKSSRAFENRALALDIAEAGIEYYRWHLAHAPNDFKDGQSATSTGPYIHAFKDAGGATIGQFALTITPPASGTTIVTISSTGTVSSAPNLPRAVRAQLAIPSLAKFAVVADADMRFGSGTEVFGPIHSNGGIRFDGLIHNVITSSKDQYNDPDHSGNDEFGVHTHLSPTDPLPPASVPSRTDVFEAGRQFPVATFDFAGITTNLSTIKTSAQSGGRYFAASGGQGYLMIMKTNDTFDLYRVNSLQAVPDSDCTNETGQDGWGTWSVGTGGSAKTFLANYAFPANNLIFVEDNLWIEGQIDTARLTIAAAAFPDNPSTRKSITVNNDLLYTNYDGRDVLALIAQKHFNVGMMSLDTLRIDAATIAQNGRAGRYYYENDCDPYHVRSDLTLFGMIGTHDRYGFAYTDGTGYAIRNIIYDANMLYSPPPNFPLTSNQYSIVSWKITR